MVLNISSTKERKRIKRNLLGLCGRETVKSIREIALAVMPLDYSGDISEMKKNARKFISLGRMYYNGDKFLIFTRITDNNPAERYRIRLESADSGWELH
ncbi:MAG: hypothetical protein AABY16_04100 [Nanoarchaeota archaeon]